MKFLIALYLLIALLFLIRYVARVIEHATMFDNDAHHFGALTGFMIAMVGFLGSLFWPVTLIGKGINWIIK